MGSVDRAEKRRIDKKEANGGRRVENVGRKEEMGAGSVEGQMGDGWGKERGRD